MEEDREMTAKEFADIYGKHGSWGTRLAKKAQKMGKTYPRKRGIIGLQPALNGRKYCGNRVFNCGIVSLIVGKKKKKKIGNLIFLP